MGVQYTLAALRHKLTLASRAPLVFGAAIAGLLLAVAGDGPDFGHYADWAAAVLTADIFHLRGNVLSPAGVPYSLSAVGPGLLFAVSRVVLLPLTLGSAALAAGWVATLTFWACSLAALLHLARRHDALALIGAGAMFLGTHAGFYSHAYASEAFANALVAALWVVVLTRGRSPVVDSAVAGMLAGLLLLVRAYVVVYAVPALCVAVFARRPGRRSAGRAPVGRGVAWRLVAAAIPIALAAAEYGTVNAWMTGVPWRSPYVFGGDGFTSIDLRHPELLAVLTHPWHGLLSYHPLYGVAFAATVREAWRDGARRPLWLATIVAVVIHLWVQAAWSVWWLGGTTFGMRAMAPAALPLVAGLVATICRDADAQPRRLSPWVLMTALACAWSLPLLWRGNTQYLSWTDLWSAQRAAAAGVLTVAAGWSCLRLRSKAVGAEVAYGTVVVAMLAAVIAYLAWQFATLPWTGARFVRLAAGAVLAGAAISGWRRAVAPASWRPGAAPVLVAAIFVAQALLFARLAMSTSQYLASGAPPPRAFEYVSPSPVDELRVTYAEYRQVTGFAEQKDAFRRFLSWQRIEAARLSPADRRLAEQVRERLLRDPGFGDQLVEVVVRDGVAVITGTGMSEAQALRARELARSVAGVSGVTVRAG